MTLVLLDPLIAFNFWSLINSFSRSNRRKSLIVKPGL